MQIIKSLSGNKVIAFGKTNFKSILVAIVLFLGFCFLMPGSLFKTPFSTILTDRNGDLLAGYVADDGQWRFPPGDSVPEKFKQSILYFEDEFFFYHPGINPLSLVRATYQNIKERKTVSGGSTITMQVIRLARPAPRTIYHKLKEMLLAIRLELSISKDSILSLYASQAPFGGNTVGLEAAAWRYFSHPPGELTWAESALLAVLPNAPSLVYPGRNRQKLINKRNRLLQKLFKNNVIDATELYLALAEPLPDEPGPIPQMAPHLLDAQIIKNRGTKQRTTIDQYLQKRASEIVNRHGFIHKQNQIHNAAAIIVSIETGCVMAYVGNTSGTGPNKSSHVDIIMSPRSPGSILKPLLYAASLQDGLILPYSLLPDIPTYYHNFSPQNYMRRFDGAIPANEALSRSLNVPFVRLLNEYGGEKFLALLQQCGFSSIQKSYEHYGLSLILGGCETSLWDLAGCYSSMARTLNHYSKENSTYRRDDFRPLTTSFKKYETKNNKSNYANVFQASAIYYTFKSMAGVQRPPEETGWENFSSTRAIAWKTGTSYGFRDAWSIGVTPEYLVAVWVGNASGEGRPGIIGGSAAAPIMFELFNLLPQTTKFVTPWDNLIKTAVCNQSGERAGMYCENPDSVYIPATSKKTEPCSYHKLVHLTTDGIYQTRLNCEPSGVIKTEKRFVLPPIMEWYYKIRHPEYRSLPPFKPGCETNEPLLPIDFIYPPVNSTVFVPTGFDGQLSRVILKAVHRNAEATLYWHFNGSFLGITKYQHQFEVIPLPGLNSITVVDEEGNRLTRKMNCTGK